MNKEEFQEALVEVYDNLSKEQFELLLKNSHKSIKNLLLLGLGKSAERTDENPPDFIFENKLHQLAYDVFNTVFESKRISFKQFKMLSAFSKTNWFADTTEKEEFKQF